MLYRVFKQDKCSRYFEMSAKATLVHWDMFSTYSSQREKNPDKICKSWHFGSVSYFIISRDMPYIKVVTTFTVNLNSTYFFLDLLDTRANWPFFRKVAAHIISLFFNLHQNSGFLSSEVVHDFGSPHLPDRCFPVANILIIVE